MLAFWIQLMCFNKIIVAKKFDWVRLQLGQKVAYNLCAPSFTFTQSFPEFLHNIRGYGSLYLGGPWPIVPVFVYRKRDSRDKRQVPDGLNYYFFLQDLSTHTSHSPIFDFFDKFVFSFPELKYSSIDNKYMPSAIADINFLLVSKLLIV